MHPANYRPYPHVPHPLPLRPGAPPAAAAPAPPRPPPPTQELAQTATIRNAVNLKKASLAVAPLPSDPSKLAITFAFDASAPCVATTFVLASEEPSKQGCKLSTAAQAPAPGIQYQQGMGLSFPGSNAPREAVMQHVVDLSLYEGQEDSMCAAKGDTYPLIVRLETISDRGAKEGHRLEELVPGGEQKPWVQSQTTFAKLHKEEDGSWGVRAIKQKIWVDGQSYELQEIYGLEHADGGAQEAGEGSAADSEERLCVICLVAPRDTTVLPCRHMCMCHECAQELRKQSSKCPICRNHVESLLHIRIGKKGRETAAAAAAGSGANGTPTAANAATAVKAS